VSLAPVVADPTATVKQVAYTQHQHPFYGAADNWQAWGYSVRTDRWRYTEWRALDDGGVRARELYDHQADPEETLNVAHRYPDVVATHAMLITEAFGAPP
jgi:iduronate 2-sulfatase